MKPLKNTAILFTFFFLIPLIAERSLPMAAGQTPQATVDPVLQAAIDAAALAKARAEKAADEKKEAEAERDKLKAIAQPLGTPSITSPSGNVTTDQGGFVETQILGREAAIVVTNRLTKELNEKGFTTLVIYNPTDITALTSYMSVLQQLQEFDEEFKVVSLLTSSTVAAQLKNDTQEFLADPDGTAGSSDLMTAMAAPAIGAGIVKSVAELAQLFRSSTNFVNKDVPVTEDMIVSLIVKELNADKAVYYPSLFPPNFLNAGDTTEAVVIFARIKKGRNAAAEDSKTIGGIVDQLTARKAEWEGKIASAQPAEAELLRRRIAKAKSLVSQLAALKKRVDFLLATSEQVIAGLETPDPTTKMIPLAQLVRAGHLQKLLADENTNTLRLSVAANGTTKIRQWLFLDAKVRHSAGATLSFQLFNKNGRLIAGDSFQFYFDWKSAEQVRACLSTPCTTTDEKKK